ncbi:hypothetical protein Mapa_010025 [Marchantia paleacea]|nr:hypothetical protein Mapa_010025 [Marchantia paleacea]
MATILINMRNVYLVLKTIDWKNSQFGNITACVNNVWLLTTVGWKKKLASSVTDQLHFRLTIISTNCVTGLPGLGTICRDTNE